MISPASIRTQSQFCNPSTRGAEWAATGKVKQKIPSDFPGPDKVSTRTF